MQTQIGDIRDTNVAAGGDRPHARSPTDQSAALGAEAEISQQKTLFDYLGVTKWQRSRRRTMASRQLSQQEIDAVFQNTQGRPPDRAGAKRAVPFDFRRPDRIAKSQLRAIHQLHDNFVRNLVSSLSAYLRSYLIINLVSVEQLSYSEFLECLPSPTCIASLGLKPYDGNAVLELNSSLIFPILEILLGGDGKLQFSAQREITEIEQVLLDGLCG